jgi:CRP-like cAMP-binding protein
MSSVMVMVRVAFGRGPKRAAGRQSDYQRLLSSPNDLRSSWGSSLRVERSSRCSAVRCYSTSRMVEDLSLYAMKKKVLLRGAMVKPRRMSLPVPSFLLSGGANNGDSIIGGLSAAIARRHVIEYKLSNLAGHGAFVFLALSYLESDFMNLRLYAASGISLSIIFQYYREKPLWIPIRWNTLFLLINATMILLILKEANDANNIPEEQQHLYETVFESRGMKPVDFLHLMSIAKRQEVQRGEKLVVQGDRNTQVHLVQSGKLSVKRGQDVVGTIGANQFIGEAAFLRWRSGKTDETSRTQSSLSRPLELGYAAAVSEYTRWTGVGAYPPSKLTSANHTSDDHPVAASTVSCLENSILYSWNFSDINDLLIDEPIVGLAFERCLSSDLSGKMFKSRSQEPSKLYRFLLAGALLDAQVGSVI